MVNDHADLRNTEMARLKSSSLPPDDHHAAQEIGKLIDDY